MFIKQQKPNKLFEDGPDWEWEDNLKYWYCVLDGGMKAIIWCEWLNPPDPNKKTNKLSKSDSDEKILWDGICMGVPGGPEPDIKPGPILYWIRCGIKESKIK